MKQRFLPSLLPILTVMFCLTPVQHAQPQKAQPIEIGTVKWNKDFDEALQRSKEEGKPVFALFQEVPGCSGCKTFGRVVLSHPLIVEAIESEFIPILIYNNRGGKDREILKRYNEPAWNFQVIRFLDQAGNDIIPRRDKIWSVTAVAQRMSVALQAHGKTSPRYLNGVAVDYGASGIAEAVFTQHCFWTGEQKLGGLDGVVRTEAGFYEGNEVTRVWFDSNKISTATLIQAAQAAGVAEKIYLPSTTSQENVSVLVREFRERRYRAAPTSDQKRQLQGTPMAKLDLDEFQRTKVNAWVRTNFSLALQYLSPRQTERIGQKS